MFVDELTDQIYSMIEEIAFGKHKSYDLVELLVAVDELRYWLIETGVREYEPTPPRALLTPNNEPFTF